MYSYGFIEVVEEIKLRSSSIIYVLVEKRYSALKSWVLLMGEKNVINIANKMHPLQWYS